MSMFGWSPLVVAGVIALWTVGYGAVQFLAPRFVAPMEGAPPSARHIVLWTAALAAIPLAMALVLAGGVFPALTLVGGLAVFGAVFAVTAAVHSYTVVQLAESEKAAMTVGFYYMSNAGGRLLGTALSGIVYPFGGMVGALSVAAVFIAAAALITTALVPASERDTGWMATPGALAMQPAQ
jgi:hypothetical protein